jgi:2-oxoglutarate dehydrogenase E1 component
MKDFSYVFNAHPQYIDSLYQAYRKDPSSVDSGGVSFLKVLSLLKAEMGMPRKQPFGPTGETINVQKELSVMTIIQGFRTRGHLLSTTNPIRLAKTDALSRFGGCQFI